MEPETWGEAISRNAANFADSPAFVCGERTLSFREFNTRAKRLAAALRAEGLKKGEVFGALAWNSIEYALLYGAAMKGGYIFAPMNPRLTLAEVRPLIGYSEAKLLFVDGDWERIFAEELPEPGAPRALSLEKTSCVLKTLEELIGPFQDGEPESTPTPGDPFALFFTSGTTGAPKGGLYAHGPNLLHTRARARLASLVPEASHVMVLPLFHIGGFSHFWAFFLQGSPNIFPEERNFDAAKTLDLLEAHRATDIHIVPTLLPALLAEMENKPRELANLRCMWYAASPMPAPLLKRGIERFGKIFRQGYGQTETGPDITSLSALDHDVAPENSERLASCGRPVPGVAVRLLDDAGREVEQGEVGEVTVKSPTAMLCYWKLPEVTARTVIDGWVHTGDLGRFDKDGYLYLVGRKSDMIISGGENVHPREIEETILAFPGIAEAAVIGLPDPRWIERVHAVIVPLQGAKPDQDELKAFLRERLAAFKVPKSMEFVSALPKNPQGKVLKRTIREERL